MTAKNLPNLPNAGKPDTRTKPASKPVAIVKSLPKIGENFTQELAKLNEAFSSVVPKPITYNKADNTFSVGARTIAVGDDLSTLFANPATAEQIALEQEAKQTEQTESGE